MSNRRFILSILVSTLFAGSASALNNRSAVSVGGLDSNPCTVASPCRSFSVALAATASGGEVVALDSAGYGPFTIHQDVTVTGAPGIHAAITAPAGVAIDISGGSHVFLANLTILGNGSGTTGIRNTGALFLHVQNCFIEGFAGFGVVQPSGSMRTLVDHSTIDNDATGIEFADSSGVVDSSTINDCQNFGIRVVNTASPPTSFVVTSSMLRWNQVGVDVAANTSGSGVRATIDRCSFVNNGAGVQVNEVAGAFTTVILMSNNLESITGNGAYYSTGNNFIDLVSASLTQVGFQ
jgi:Right handed beta helix region